MSSCLAGLPVRYNGGDKRHTFVVETLAAVGRLVVVCPEVELGLGTPRKALQLVRTRADLRMLMADGSDWTETMRAFARERVEALAVEDLDGYVLKARSPSCGVSDVPVRDEAGHVTYEHGLFATALVGRWPDLPVTTEVGLADPDASAHFLARVFAYRAVKTLFAPGWTMGSVVAFHQRHKLALLAHDEVLYRRLGRLVGEGPRDDRPHFRARYIAAFTAAFRTAATAGGHVNALMHAMGHLRGRVTSTERDSLLASIDDARCGVIPLQVPRAQLLHFAELHDVRYLLTQTYFAPPQQV